MYLKQLNIFRYFESLGNEGSVLQIYLYVMLEVRPRWRVTYNGDLYW